MDTNWKIFKIDFDKKQECVWRKWLDPQQCGLLNCICSWCYILFTIWYSRLTPNREEKKKSLGRLMSHKIICSQRVHFLSLTGNELGRKRIPMLPSTLLSSCPIWILNEEAKAWWKALEQLHSDAWKHLKLKYLVKIDGYLQLIANYN